MSVVQGVGFGGLWVEGVGVEDTAAFRFRFLVDWGLGFWSFGFRVWGFCA